MKQGATAAAASSVPVRVIPPGVTGADLARGNQHGPVGRSRYNRCSICHQPGHKALTCPKRVAAAKPERGATPRARVVKARKPSAPDPLRSPARLVASRVNGAKGGRPQTSALTRQLDGGVRLSVTIALSAADLREMDSESMSLLFDGLARLLSASGAVS